MCVVDGYLPYILRERSGEFAGWIHIAEQHIGDGVAGLALPPNHTFRIAGTFFCSRWGQRPAGE